MNKYFDKIFIDFETKSKIVLDDNKGGGQGLYHYATDTSTNILCICWFYNGIFGQWVPKLGNQGKEQLIKILLKPELKIFAHNSEFEFFIYRNVLEKKHSFPHKAIKDFYCTSAIARYYSIGRSLEKVASLLKLKHQKDTLGKRKMLILSRLYKDDYKKLSTSGYNNLLKSVVQYCEQDVKTTVSIFESLGDIPFREWQLFWITSLINYRGLLIDMDLVNGVIEFFESRKKSLENELKEISNNSISSAHEISNIKRFCLDQGYEIKNLIKENLEKHLADERINTFPLVKRVLQIRYELSNNSIKKYHKIKNISKYNKIHYHLLYHGAKSGRWSGRGVQLQNLKRSSLSNDEMNKMINLIKSRQFEKLNQK